MTTLANLFDLDDNATNEDYQQATLMLPEIFDFHTVSVLVTPEIAAKWLHRNDINRPVRRKAVAQYSADLTRGMWKATGESIKFSRTGRLLDGQHRLAAIVDAGVTHEWLVTTGLDDDAFDAIDTGRRRTGADILAIEGVGVFEAKHAAAALPMVMNYLRGMVPHSSNRYSNQEILETWHSDPSLLTTSRFISHLPHRMIPLTHAKAFFLHWAFGQFDVRAADLFIEQLFHGDHLAKADPVYHLRAKLLQDRISKHHPEDGAQLHACIKAWNARRAGKAIIHWRTLFPRSDEPFPRIAE